MVGEAEVPELGAVFVDDAILNAAPSVEAYRAIPPSANPRQIRIDREAQEKARLLVLI